MGKTGFFEMCKKITALAAAAVMAVTFVGCGDENGGSEATKQSAKSKVKINDIEWSIDEDIIDGDREICFNVTNNSDLYITYFEIQYNFKENASEDEKEAFYNLIYKEYDLDEESEEDREEIRNGIDKIKLKACSDKTIAPGESWRDDYVSMGWLSVVNINIVDYFESDIATFKYLYDGNIYTAYYDYKSKKYSVSDSTQPAYEWSEYDIGNKVPKFDAIILEKDYYDEDEFKCIAHCVTKEQFNKYIDDCKAMGYTVDAHDSEIFADLWYDAKNNDGYDLHLSYNQNVGTLEIRLLSPDF